MTKLGARCEDCDSQGPLYLHARCHPAAPPWAILTGNVVTLECSECKRLVSRLQVIPQPPARELAAAGFTARENALKTAQHALNEQHEAIDRLLARLSLNDQNFLPSKSGQPWAALLEGNEALKVVDQALRAEATEEERRP